MADAPLPVVGQIAELLTARAWLLATAEAASGGAVAFALTGVPGASRFFAGGVVAGHGRAWPILGLPIDATAPDVAQLARLRMGADVGLCVGPRSGDGRAAAVALAGLDSSREGLVELGPANDAEDVGDRVLALVARWLGESPGRERPGGLALPAV